MDQACLYQWLQEFELLMVFGKLQLVTQDSIEIVGSPIASASGRQFRTYCWVGDEWLPLPCTTMQLRVSARAGACEKVTPYYHLYSELGSTTGYPV